MPDVEHETLADALYAIRQEVGPLFRGAEADTGKFTYRYVTLPALVERVDPIAKRHGVILRHILNLDVMRHELWFNDGEKPYESYDVILPNPAGTAQGLGSAITYFRRYDYTTTFGLVVDLDDDGAAASVVSPTVESRPSPLSPAGTEGGDSRTTAVDRDF